MYEVVDSQTTETLAKFEDLNVAKKFARAQGHTDKIIGASYVEKAWVADEHFATVYCPTFRIPVTPDPKPGFLNWQY